MIIRIIASPFLFMMMMVKFIGLSINNCRLFIKHGGEWITYQKTDRKMIYDIYKKLQEDERQS